MEFTFSEVIAALCLKHGIDPEHTGAFRGRVQHMQRSGFPPGVNTGKGNTVSYGWQELLLLALAFEYLEVGATPERAIAETTKFESLLLTTLADVANAQPDKTVMHRLPCFVIAQLTALLRLKAEGEWEQTCKIVSKEDIDQMLSLEGDNEYLSPYALIDLRQLLGGLLTAVCNVCKLDSSIVARDIKLWAGRQHELS